MSEIHELSTPPDLDSFYHQICHKLALELRIASPIDQNANLLQLGLDSMRLMKWLHDFRRQGYKVTLKELYHTPTLAGWKALMHQKLSDQKRADQKLAHQKRSHQPHTHQAISLSELSLSELSLSETSPPRADQHPIDTNQQPALSEPQQATATSHWPTMRSGQAFELTPVQHAYLVGRSPQQTLGGVGCHLYQEFDGRGLSAERLERAIWTLIDYHPMLRVHFRSDGYQQYQPTPQWQGVTTHDLSAHSPEQCDQYLQHLRETLGHRVLQVEQGETFDVQLSLLPEGRHRLHVNIDLLIMDAASFSLFFSQLHQLLSGQSLPPAESSYDFCSYLSQQRQENAPLIGQSKQYWLERLADFPPAPILPLATDPDSLTQVRISRRRMTITAERWQQFITLSGQHSVTPTMVLATCFSAVLARWGGLSRLLLNLTLFDRQPLHPAVETMMADFTAILLLDIHCHGQSIHQLAQKNQQTFVESYDHRHWSGVELLRELKKTQDYPQGVPIVFTSNLGQPLYGTHPELTLGEPAWGISQTPQVWLDHLAFEVQDQVILQWDSNDDLFPPQLIDTLFDAYTQQINILIDEIQAWDRPFPDFMPASQKAVRQAVNATHQPQPHTETETETLLDNGLLRNKLLKSNPLSNKSSESHSSENSSSENSSSENNLSNNNLSNNKLLHDGFFHQAALQPQAIALITDQQQWCYGELAEKTRRGAGTLISRGIQVGDTVAVSMTKGPGQIVAVLSILQAGAVYVPVSLDQPEERRLTIYHGAKAKLILTCADDQTATVGPIPHLTWQEAIEGAENSTPRRPDPQQPAYIIYTSGSTGTPKGVIIAHHGALNTCHDLNRRYQITPDDRVLALSALHFDLSVYDIFGILSAGGALVLIQETQRRDPASWCELIHRHQITVWNSVPALFDILLTYSEGFRLSAPGTLRLVMLSGDWIGLDLPARYRAFRQTGQFVAMGGATEASIWSNAYDVFDVSPAWRSIPYGYPLANQFYRVVDELGNDCPDWVAGELWIGGAGVALGYFNDPQRTQAQFVTHKGERWYRTGDMGCYWPDGTLEFLGRRDKQVKIGGYRIELGEIEAALQRIQGVKQGIVLAIGEKEKNLAAFVTPQGDSLMNVQSTESDLPVNYASLCPSLTVMAETESLVTETDDLLLEEWVGDFLIDHLQQQGIDWSQPYTATSLAEWYGAQPHWHGLFSVWLDFLVQQQRLQPQNLQQHLRQQGLEQQGLEQQLQQRLEVDETVDETDITYRIVPSEIGKTPGYMTGASGPLRPIADALVSYHGTLAAILRGERAAHTLLEHPVWSPECLAALSPETQSLTASLSQLIQALSQHWGRAVQVIELGARSGVAAEHLLQTLPPEQVSYIAVDESQEMVLRSRERFAPLVHAQARRWQPETIADLAHTADIVLLNHTLHRYTDQPSPDQPRTNQHDTNQHDVLNTVCQLAAPGALGYITEFSKASPLTLISTQLLTAQPEHPLTLPSPQQWLERFRQTSLSLESEDHIAHQHRFMLRCPEQIKQPDLPRLHQALSEQLPGYMVPKRLFILPAFPLTANGKIDHPSLKAYCGNALELDETPGNETRTLPQGTAEQTVATLWHDLLGEADYHRQSDFFQAGGDSLLATRLIGALEQQSYQASLNDLFDYPTLAAFAATLHLHRNSETTVQAQITPDTASRYQPFALTEVQQAYWVGRQPGFTLGGIGSQFFVEFDVGPLDIDKLEQVWNRLIERHDMLRAVVQHGQQQVLAQVPHFTITPHRLPDETAVLALREKLAHQVRDPAQWPVCDLQVAMLPDDHAYLYLCLDNLLLDGLSMQILLAELEQGYRYPHLTRPALTVTFRDYQQHMAQQSANKAAKNYWLQRLETLPPAPQLPLRCTPESIRQPRFIRLSDRLTATTWQSLKAQAKQAQLTPSALLLSAYAAVLSVWSRESSLTLNLTLFDRHPVHPQINQVLGDFTSLLLLAWQPEPGWLDSAQALQRRLWQDLTHRDVSAVWVMRQLAMHRQQATTSMPVVFTSALGFEEERFLAHQSWLKPRWGISQTPQVWLDHQVYESEGELRFNWDAVEALFDPQHLHAMFNAYTQLLQRLATHPQDWSLPLSALVDRPKTRPESDLRVTPTPPHQPEVLKNATTASDPAPDDDQALIQLICDQFREVSHSSIQATQNFFDAGATSLMLVQLHVRLQNSYQQEVQKQRADQQYTDKQDADKQDIDKQDADKQNNDKQQHATISVHPEVTDLFAYPSPALLARYLQARYLQARYPHGQTSNAPSGTEQKPVRLAQRQQNAMRRRRHRS